jgi:hypothetical protein
VKDADKNREKYALSLLVEYILLVTILSMVLMGVAFHLDSVLRESQVSKVIDNHFSDVAAEISALYTDYVLLKPENGMITSRISILPKVGDSQYTIELLEANDFAYIRVASADLRHVAYSGLGYRKYVFENGVIGDIFSLGRTQSSKSIAESPEKPEIGYRREVECGITPKPRIELIPSSIDLNKRDNVTINVYMENDYELSSNVAWDLLLWNGSSVHGDGVEGNVTVIISWPPDGCSIEGYNASCEVRVVAYLVDRPECNSSFRTVLLVSNNPEEAPPYLIYEKWVEPNVVNLGEKFDVRLRIEGRGFLLSAINITAVHVIDNSGSMTHPTLFQDLTRNIIPNVITRKINVSASGDVKILAYTQSSLPEWYSDELCKACHGSEYLCPWYGDQYSSSFVRLYVNGIEYTQPVPGLHGVEFEEYISQPKNYTVEVVARAPEPIDLHIEVYLNDSIIWSETYSNYTNYQDVTVTLPDLTDYTYLMIDGISGLPEWQRAARSNWIEVERYDAGCQYLYWYYREAVCGYKEFQDGNFNVWIIKPDGSKDFLYDYYYGWYQAYTYYGGVYRLDYFIQHPDPGIYRLRIVPTGKDPIVFGGEIFIKRMDAAKIASKSYNNMLGSEDFAGVVRFSTDAERFMVGSPPLSYLTRNKQNVDTIIEGLKASCATDPAEGLYEALKTFPIWNESLNNCTDCIANTRPLVILLTDGVPTICDLTDYGLECDQCRGKCYGGSYCQDAEDQARCVAEKLKSYQINEYNISLCTIGFGEDVNSLGQQFLKDIASTRPDNNEKCYFFVSATEDLVNAYRTIFNAFRVAAKNVTVVEVLNTTLLPQIEYISARAYSSLDGDISDRLSVEKVPNGTRITLTLESVKKDEVIDIIIEVRGKVPGYFNVNHESSYIEYDSLDTRGEIRDHVKIPIISERARVKVLGGRGAEIGLS